MLCTFLLARKININNNDLLNKLRGFSSISENYHDTSCKSSPFLQGKNVFIHCSIRIDVAFPISRRPEDQFAVVSSFFFFFISLRGARGCAVVMANVHFSDLTFLVKRENPYGLRSKVRL